MTATTTPNLYSLLDGLYQDLVELQRDRLWEVRDTLDAELDATEHADLVRAIAGISESLGAADDWLRWAAGRLQ